MVNPKQVGALARVHVLFCDVDGVFTDGKAWQDQTGQWRRTFSVRDTMGLRALRKAGFKICILTPAISTEIRAHFEKVGVDVFKDDVNDVRAAHDHILRAYGLTLEHAAFLTETAFNTVELRTKDGSLYVTSRAGGDGAILEISNLILQQLASLARAESRIKVGEL